MNDLIRSWINRYLSNPQILILGFLLLLGFGMVVWLGRMLAPVLAAVIVAYLLEGIVSGLERRRLPRRAAVLVVFILFMIALLALLVVVLPLLTRQVGQFIQDLPAMLAKGQALLLQLPDRYPNYITELQVRQITESLSDQTTRLAQKLLSFSVASVKGLIMAVVYLVLVPLMVFFFLKDKQAILDWVKSYLPENRGLARQVWAEVNQQIANYVQGKMLEILIISILTYVVYKFMGLRFTIIVSLITGLSVLVPYIGVTVVAFPVALIAFFQHGVSADFVYAVMAYGVIQLFDGNLLAPILLSRVVNLHPIAVIVAVLVFGGLWGMVGLFFAIPLGTLVHAVLKAWLGSLARDREIAHEVGRIG
jgi:putative permease